MKKSGSYMLHIFEAEVIAAEDRLTQLKRLMTDALPGMKAIENKLAKVEDDNAWLKEQFLAFGDHKDSCDIRESADEGRIVEGIECTCGFNELKLQFETTLRR